MRARFQYNSWFDWHRDITPELFKQSVQTIHNELVVKRHVQPLKAYVIDDGWQDATADVTKMAWPINDKFDPHFANVLKVVHDADSSLGLWLSPGCLFGARKMVPTYRKAGFEALSMGMSMCGPKYMNLLETRVIDLMHTGVTYFKFDGLFGHLNIRDFETAGRGCPAMQQLGLDGVATNDAKLNDPAYDELKTYYLVAGTERLIQIFDHMQQVNPSVYINITNGAYLSPWWLQHVDTVWMINAGDGAKGADRSAQLVYRDSIYYQIFHDEHTQFPLCAMFNHEPKKTSTGESRDEFKSYLLMSLSRGSGFMEFYLKPSVLSSADWDVLAEGLKWADEIGDTFPRARMHGGNPQENEVYGFTAWNQRHGYISIHNPSDKPQTYTFTLNRALGLLPGTGKTLFMVSTPMPDVKPNALHGLNQAYAAGDSITLELAPKEIRVIDFDKQ